MPLQALLESRLHVVADIETPSNLLLTTHEVVELLRCSVRTVHELTREGRIPRRRLSHTRGCLFVDADLQRWFDGAELEVITLPDDGRIVRIAESG